MGFDQGQRRECADLRGVPAGARVGLLAPRTLKDPRGPERAGRVAGLPAGRVAGFTLVEVLVTLGLLMVALFLLFYPILSSLGYFRTATARADAQTVGRTALEAMARELAEAMYVQLDMYDDSMIAFVPPLRLDPSDPNSEIVTPPRPDWDRAVRYWRALDDPTRNYNPGTHLEAGNMFFLARTVVPDPFTVTDPPDAWNRWNQKWADAQGGAGGTTNWAPIPRVVHTDVDTIVGKRLTTLQPGYPYLKVQYELKVGKRNAAEAGREYRNDVIGLTPDAPEYDVPQLSFTPTVVSGERLRPVEGSGLTMYRARYPLWRLGSPYTGWSALADRPDVVKLMTKYGLNRWARDPFLLIYQFDPDPAVLRYRDTPAAVGAFDPRTRTMKVVELGTGLTYDTGSSVYDRTIPVGAGRGAWFGFTVDWVDGSLRFDFPASLTMDGSATSEVKISSHTLREFPLHDCWGGYTTGSALTVFVVPDSVSIRLDNAGKEGRPLKRVYCTPHEGTDEFQLGLDPPTPIGDLERPRYGWIRLPETLSGGAASKDVKSLWVGFRWRNNGVVPPGGTMSGERPDLMVAYYRTDAVIDISMTVVRADPTAPPRTRVTQSAYLTRRVKLHNLLREIRYGED